MRYTSGVVKDRSRPFARKHRATWLVVTGGMLLIGTINVVIGFLIWPGEPPPPQPLIREAPTRYDAAAVPPSVTPDGGVAPPADAAPAQK